MKRDILILLMFILLPGMFLLPSCTQGNAGPEWIDIKGNSFVNESGETIVFHGVNIRDPHNLEIEGHWTRSHFEEASAWGATVIRLWSGQGNWDCT